MKIKIFQKDDVLILDNIKSVDVRNFILVLTFEDGSEKIIKHLNNGYTITKSENE